MIVVRLLELEITPQGSGVFKADNEVRSCRVQLS